MLLYQSWYLKGHFSSIILYEYVTVEPFSLHSFGPQMCKSISWTLLKHRKVRRTNASQAKSFSLGGLVIQSLQQNNFWIRKRNSAGIVVCASDNSWGPEGIIVNILNRSYLWRRLCFHFPQSIKHKYFKSWDAQWKILSLETFYKSLTLFKETDVFYHLVRCGL